MDCLRKLPCFRKTSDKKEETQRIVHANDPANNALYNYANNYIRTSKYKIYTFLPLNLYEQFQRIANTYFLCLVVLQVIPWISSLTWVTTVAPLVLVLTLTAIKDAFDDFQRHRSDNIVNNRESKVLRGTEFESEKWQNVVVGDIILVSNNEFIAADLLLLATSEPNSLCYIETAELDGETNLKVRQAHSETTVFEHKLDTKCKLVCEPPNNVLSKFDGTLEIFDEKSDTKLPISNDQILLRGCVLRNTQWCYGLVIFAGQDTKLMKNSGKSVFKRTSTDRLLNVLIIGIVVFLLCLCLLCVIACGIWETIMGHKFQTFLPWESFIPGTSTGMTAGSVYGGATAITLLIFFSYLILFNTVVPISLYVSVEFLRLVQSFWINWDVKMYYDVKDTPAKARTTALNEELGQIEYIFSDKTGTLTQNIMTFNKCSIKGKAYGDPRDAAGNPIRDEIPPKCNLSDNKYYDKLAWYDNILLKDIKSNDEGCLQFFRLLALCHTVMPENKDGKLNYLAQSPDEEALVGAARDLGFVFKSRTPTTITIEVLGQTETYDLLCILDFNNVRKRMSVIVKKDNKILLLCKGADTTVNARLSKKSADLLQQTCTHLNEYANLGLRTLTLAYKELDLDVYNKWKQRHYECVIALTNRDDLLHNIYEEIEVEMDLIGATAIEDKLQDGVPNTIARLINAGIKIWVLTGDKQETAINIGYSCKLLTEEMEEVFVVDGETFETVKDQLKAAKERMDEILAPNGKASSAQSNGSPIELVSYMERGQEDAVNITQSQDDDDEEEEFGGFGIVINGHSLVHGLSDDLKLDLLEVGCLCKAVICCRVTPLQKAQVVELVKNNKKSVTLAIGDGANDVSMIKTAHIGVGISGQEGMQAVLSSDYSFAQFRFLERLLLVHGRWSYYRMCKFLSYFFYKNFAFTLTHFWYAFFIGFSAQTVYDESFISIYNVVFTSMPIIMLGIFDRDVGEEYSVKYPKLYTPGLLNLFFNKKKFAFSLVEGLITSCVVYFVSYLTLTEGIMYDGKDIASNSSVAFMSASILIVVVTVRCALEMCYWTPLNFLFTIGSVAIYYVFFGVLYSGVISYKHMGVLKVMCSTPNYWLGILFAVVLLLLPVVAMKFFYLTTKMTLSDRLRVRAADIRKSKSHARPMHKSKNSIKREKRQQSLRSSYAFAQEPGYGDFITSGRYIRKPEDTGAKAAAASAQEPGYGDFITSGHYIHKTEETGAKAAANH